MRGGELIAEYLVAEKVPYVFGLCGHGIVGLMDALGQRAERIRMIGVHHEQVAGYMADAYYRVSHRPAATFTSCGPGSVNLAIALACAMMDSSALVAITGNVPTPQWNRGPFQETYRHHQADFPAVIRPYVKRAFQVPRAEMLPLALRQAFKTAATGRPGPVNVDVPLDVFVEETTAAVPDPDQWWHAIDRRPGPSPEAARRALDLLVGAARPAILVGNGAVLSDAAPEIRRLADVLGVPVANTPQGAGVMPADHPLAVGVVGRNGTNAANQVTRQADVLLALGARFDDLVSSGWVPGYSFAIPPTRLIHVDLDPDEIGRNYPVHFGVTADVRSFVRALLALAESGDGCGAREAWLDQVAGWQRDWAQFNARRYRADAVPIQPEHLIRTLRRAVPRDGIVLADVGVHHNWMVQQWPVHEPRTLLQSWGFAAMGFAVGGGSSGDLYLTIAVQTHSKFERKGDDLTVEVPVGYADAVLGGEVEVPTLEGRLMLKVPPLTQNGRQIKLTGKGMPVLGANKKGDLFVRVRVQLPEQLSDEERLLFEQLRELQAKKAGVR
jgi:acetolactate synthase-1/2/3 large subunit